MRGWLLLAAVVGSAGQAPSPIPFANLAPAFDAFATRTADRPMAERVAAFHRTFDRLAPGLYADRDPARLDRRIAQALAGFPAIRPVYRQVERRFAGDLAAAVDRFRMIFPGFVSPLPIILAHELGVRDGGSGYVGDRKVMLFGADMIATLHNDDTLQPFLQHELFHLQHARRFTDCDQLWCPLWQEGLATYAASRMTPGASDHQLLLDQPAPIREPTDARFGEALCWVARRFDSVAQADIDGAFTGGRSVEGFPSRFGYYIGLRLAAEAGKTRGLPVLAALPDEAARPVVTHALGSLIAAAHAPCRAPGAIGPVTRAAPRPA